MTDVNSESQGSDPIGGNGRGFPAEPSAQNETTPPLDPLTDGPIAAASPSQDLPPGETPIYVGTNGVPARPPVGPQFVCPFCGGRTSAMARCDQCRGPLDPLSRQATQNTMGPWFIRDEGHPFRPGCSYGMLAQLVQRGKVTMETVLRGPTTRQFWMPLRRVPGVAHLLGLCHSCQTPTSPEAMGCGRCGASFVVEEDRQNLGLGPVHLLPGQASADRIASSSLTPSPTAPMFPNSSVPPLVSAAGPYAAGMSRDRARMNRMEREAGALKLSLGIAAVIVVVLLAAFMLAILDGRLGLGLGIADIHAPESAPANPSAASSPVSDAGGQPLLPGNPDQSGPSPTVPSVEPPPVRGQPPADQSAVDAFDQAVAAVAEDTPEAIQRGVSQMRSIKTADAGLAKRISDAIKAADARMEQLKVRRGL